jgi:hypothetical protein
VPGGLVGDGGCGIGIADYLLGDPGQADRGGRQGLRGGNDVEQHFPGPGDHIAQGIGKLADRIPVHGGEGDGVVALADLDAFLGQCLQRFIDGADQEDYHQNGGDDDEGSDQQVVLQDFGVESADQVGFVDPGANEAPPIPSDV